MADIVQIQKLMAQSGVKFGTSGARGLVVQMTDRVCAAYAMGFLQHQRARGGAPDVPVVIGGDLRPSTARIATAVAFAARHLGHPVEFAGWVPSPAVALRGLILGAPAIMVTGSHIPDDRNGIKFNTHRGEVTKEDEAGVIAQQVELPPVFDESGMFLPGEGGELPAREPAAGVAYVQRYLDACPPACLSGLSLGVYGHSAVGRDLLVELYEALGAKVTRLGFSEIFVPVDTEAIRPEDAALAKEWAAAQHLDAIVSTDGDSDRPLTFDERGDFIRGDVSGILVAQYLGADAVATPVSCNTAVDVVGFRRVERTRIGSPYVIAGMEAARATNCERVVGYEANGGFLTLSDFTLPRGGLLPALPTRDAVIVHLGLLLSARASGCKLSDLLRTLPPRFTASDRDQAFSQERSGILLALLTDSSAADLEVAFALGRFAKIDQTDGVRITFDSGEVVHLRASGNAPELRCYAEADSEERAIALVSHGLKVARTLAPSA